MKRMTKIFTDSDEEEDKNSDHCDTVGFQGYNKDKPQAKKFINPSL